MAHGNLSDHLQQQALEWLVVMTSGAVDQNLQTQFEHWLTADPLHAEAYREAEALWQQLGQLADYPPFQSSLNQPAAPRPVRRSLRRWPRHSLAIAACSALFLLLAAPWLSVQLQADYRTGSGETKTLPLADGSVVYLNTNSAIALDDRADRRGIRLLQGEAEFVVKKDPVRPFVVSVGDETIKALGTDFIVRCESQQLTVTMLESRVEIKIPEQAETLILNPGEQLRHHHGSHFEDKVLVDTQKVSAWRRGKLIFESTPLKTVIAELNRYRSGQVILLSDDLAQLPVSGVFDIQHLDRLLGVIEQSLAVKSIRVSEQLTLIHAKT